MIAVSSHRPFCECAPEIALNQQRANDSWRNKFEKIIYVGPYDPELDGPNVCFHHTLEQPQIKTMCMIAGRQKDWTAILNADVVLGDGFNMMESRLKRTLAKAAISCRWQFDPAQGLDGAKVTDLGLDFFAATPDIWLKAAIECPPELRIGRILWDTWMLGFLTATTNGNVADVTQSRVVYHPYHQNRKDQSMPVPTSLYMGKVAWPVIKV